jgi:hypothetical protein
VTIGFIAYHKSVPIIDFRYRGAAANVDFDLRGDVYIELDELDDLTQRIGEFLLTRNPVLIDRTSIKPMFDRKQPRQGRYQRHATTRTTQAPENLYDYCWCHHHLLIPRRYSAQTGSNVFLSQYPIQGVVLPPQLAVEKLAVKRQYQNREDSGYWQHRCYFRCGLPARGILC